jgi:endonuclease/exonuclease/phosphatase family metal-dependent hydrolase
MKRKKEQILAVVMSLACVFGITVFSACSLFSSGDAGESSQSGNINKDLSESGESDKNGKGEDISTTAVKLNGVDLALYDIVYPQASDNREEEIAEMTANAIERDYGVTLAVKSDEKTVAGYELRIGQTNRFGGSGVADDEYSLFSAKQAVTVYSCTTDGLLDGAKTLVDSFAEENGEKSADFKKEVVGKTTEKSLGIMSYNVRNVINEAVSGEARVDRVVANIKSEMPDSFGVQEATYQWMTYLNQKLGDIYTAVGVGRDGGTSGEYSAVFYKTSEFNLIDSATKWLSDTPDVKSKYSQSQYIRIMTYALLERKSDGVRYLHINTHLDLNADARIPQSDVLMSYADLYSRYPVFVTGDYNDSADDNAVAHMKANGYKNSAEEAKVKTDVGYTYPTPLYSSTANSPKVTLDYCLVKGSNVFFDSYKVMREQVNGGWSSDHFPISMKYTLYNAL